MRWLLLSLSSASFLASPSPLSPCSSSAVVVPPSQPFPCCVAAVVSLTPPTRPHTQWPRQLLTARFDRFHTAATCEHHPHSPSAREVGCAVLLQLSSTVASSRTLTSFLARVTMV